MTIEEYSTLMGYEKACGMEEYAAADAAYMMAGDMDKQAFCEEWKEHGGSPLVRLLANAARNGAAFRAAEDRKHRAAHGILRLSEALTRGIKDDGRAAEALGNIAAKMIGRADCIRWKLEQGFSLGDADKAYIMDNLKP